MFKSLSLQKNKLMMLALAMVLTLAMVILPGMNVVKADTPVNATVSFLENGVAIDPSMENIPVSVSGTAAVLAPLPTNYPNSGTPTAFDATISAYYDVMGSQSLDGLSYGYDSNPQYGDPGYYVTYLLGTPSEETVVNYSSAVGQSYWHGYTWVLYVNDVESSAYASNIVLDDNGNNEIVWDYKYVEVVW